MDVIQSSSWSQLEALAKKPFDLASAGALADDGRIGKMVCTSAGLRLLYATQRIEAQTLSALQDFASEHHLVERYQEMRQGAVINRIDGWESENRQVLHTSSRDLFSSHPAEPVSAKQARIEYQKLQAFLDDLGNGTILGSMEKPFTTMINVGIGGSDLGPRSIYEALKAYRIDGRTVRFISNVDPDDAAEVLASTDLSETLVNVVSKSGTTLETLTNEALVRQAFKDQGLDPTKHFVAVTGAGSPMDNPDHYLRSFYMFDYIGGRYSSSSMVGCVMLGFALGFEQLGEFLRGAHEMDKAAANPVLDENMPLLLALLGVWNHNFLGYPTLAILPYSQALHRFPAHLQQCDMESNGKSVTTAGTQVQTKTGPIIWGEPGTNGQHAFYQLLHQGTEIVPIEFIGFLCSQYGRDITIDETTSQQKLVANLLAQSVALASGQAHENPNKIFRGNRPSSLILGNKLDPQTMGALLALYEAKIVFQGFSWQINSFDQEGVQLGKVLASRFLDSMSSRQKSGLSIEKQFLKVLEK
ncbi:MAG: glucose-6-phosphate isomerase [Deltaproteobacteria bacterium]|nr:glucose-6-phosphate isomerase [Deltaproteobacteria bacterium]